MRIKKKQTSGLRLGRLGKVKVGKLSEKGYPISLSSFRFTSNEPHRIKAMANLLGENPTKIPITFHSNNIDDVCSERLEIRNNKGELVCYGDGEIFYRSTDKGFILEDAKTWGVEKYMNGLANKLTIGRYKAEWKEVLTLRFLIIGCTELGVWEFRTAAKETTIPQIVSTFDMTLQNAGRVTMIPFQLTVSKQKSNRVGVSRQYPVVNLICDLSLDAHEQVLNLGNDVKGLLTNEKINASAKMLGTSEEITEYEIIDDL